MRVFEKKSQLAVPAQELYDWHMQPGAFDRLVPPWQRVEVVERPTRLVEGAKLVMKVFAGPISVRWVALHRDFIEGRQFIDDQVHGPFKQWVHTHSFEAIDDQTSMLTDRIEYELPLGPLGALFGGLPTDLMLEKMFEFRHRATREALSR